MKVRFLAWPLAAVAVLAVILYTDYARARMQANRVLRQVELLGNSVPSSAPLLRVGLRALRRAGHLDPADGRIPLMIGVVHEHLGHDRQALRALEEALRLEARGETYLALGQVLQKRGRCAEARQSFLRAEALDRTLAKHVPEGVCQGTAEGRAGDVEKGRRRGENGNKGVRGVDPG